MQFVYFGSSTFSRIILEELFKSEIKPALIVSQPDKPKGRGLVLRPMEVSAFSIENNLPLIRPDSLTNEEARKKIQSQNPDFIIVADYGKILPASILSLAKVLPLAVHPSLLPRYRGASPINYALINGETQSGTTIFKMNEKLDSGEIILQEMLAIEENDDVLTLNRKLALLGVKLLIRALAMIARDEYALIAQDERAVSFAPKLTKEDGKIDWQFSAARIKNLIRGLKIWPSAFTYYKNKLLKILQAEVLAEAQGVNPGTIIEVKKDGIYVATGAGILKLKQVKPEGKKEMDAYAFAIGHKVKVGEKFGK